jgi:hypothetical protein
VSIDEAIIEERGKETAFLENVVLGNGGVGGLQFAVIFRSEEY